MMRKKRPAAWLSDSKGSFACGLLCAIYLVWTLLGFAGAETKRAVSDCVTPLISTIGALWGVWGYRRLRRAPESFRNARNGWATFLLTLAVAAFGLGSALWAYYDLILHENPFPSWADAAYLVCDVSMILGVSLLSHRPQAGVARVRVVLDVLMTMAALGTLSWFFILGPTILGAKGTALSKALGVAYPLFDLAILFCVLVLSARTQNRGMLRVRNLLCASLVAFVWADASFAYLTLQERYEAGNPCDVGWIVAVLLMGQAAYAIRRLPTPSAEAHEDRRFALGRTLLPYALVPLVGGLLVHVWRERISGGLANGVYVGSAVLVGLIMVRQVFAIAENSRLYRFLQAAYRDLEALATTDAMTSLPNHRVFQERLRAALAEGASIALLLVDVDRFKQYNDVFGHPAGDEALKIVARTLRKNLREGDLAARYGGEEFVVVLQGPAAAEAAECAERLRAACEATAFPHRAVTLSIGVAIAAECGAEGRDADALIEAADHALYAAKHGGRNRVALEKSAVQPNPEREAAPSTGWSLEASRALNRARLTETPDGPVVRALLAMLGERRDTSRIMDFALRLAEEASVRRIAAVNPEEIGDLHLSVLLHGLGRVGVPDAVFLKPEERAVLQRHPIQDLDLLSNFPGVGAIVRSHRERWDGTGYPDGLAGEAIPLGARLFALAKALDSMSRDRPHRAALSYPAIRDEIRRLAGFQFDPALVAAFLSVPPEAWASIREGVGTDEYPLAA